MDELTPMDSEYRELPPQSPTPSPVGYYGTGRPPAEQKSKAPLISAMIFLLLASNLVTLLVMGVVRERTEQISPGADSGSSLLPTQLQVGTSAPITPAQVYEKIRPSLAMITTQDGTATGTGVVLTQDGYVLTNASAVSGALLLYVSVDGQELLPAELMGTNPSCDLALLKTDAELHPAELGSIEGLSAGDTVLTVSYPFGADLAPTLLSGRLASIDDSFSVHGQSMTVLQTDAALNSSLGGGPLLNSAGQIVAFTVANVGDYRSYETVSQIGFAVSIGNLQELLQEMVRSDERPAATLGITAGELSDRIRRLYALPAGLYVESIHPSSNARTAGLRRGDTIVSIDGLPTPDFNTYQSILRTYHPGDMVEIILYRNGLYYRTTVELNAAE